MKAHLFYIVFLLACFVLPAAAQTDTKSAPDAPAMPYKLSLNIIGNNKGTVVIEDNTPGGNGIVFTDKDTLVYGAPLPTAPDTAKNPNATTVKFTVTSQDGYSRRTNYPRLYKIKDAQKTQLPLSIVTNENPAVYTFSMPDSPVTIEVAYATKLKSADDITLKKAYSSSTEVIADLPSSAVFTLESGHKVSLPVASWTYNTTDNDGSSEGYNNQGTGGAYNADTAAVNIFTCTLNIDAFPQAPNDSLIYLLTDSAYKVKVANITAPLVPEGNTGQALTITPGTGDNLAAQLGDDGQPQPFNGTIGDNATTTTVQSITITGNVNDATLTLNNVKVENSSGEANTEIADGASVTLVVQGESDLGTLTISSGASVILHPEDGASIGNTQVANNGTFIDSTATVTTVTGSGALDIAASLQGGKEVPVDTPVTLTATTNDAGAAGSTTTFLWQKKNSDGSYTDVVSHTTTPAVTTSSAPITRAGSTGLTDTYQPPTGTAGTSVYRCLIKRESIGVLTLLSTQNTTVTVTPKSDPVTPPPGPSETVYYDVTLPTLTGATTDPSAGTHQVEAWDNFGFFLTLDKDYDQSSPVVTTSRGETITPRSSDGKYIIKYVRQDIVISITGIEKNNATANEAPAIAAPSVNGGQGYISITLPQPSRVVVHTFTGALVKVFSLPSGHTRCPLSPGFYLITIGNSTYKVRVN